MRVALLTLRDPFYLLFLIVAISWWYFQQNNGNICYKVKIR